MTTSDMSPADLAVCCGNNNDGFGGGNGWWILLLFLLAGNGAWGFGGGFGGGYGNMMLGYDFPWLLNGQQQISNNTNNGFRDALINDGITSIRDGISGISTQLCGGFAGTTAAITNAQNALAQQMYTNQIADLERSYAAQTANTAGLSNVSAQLSQCCCENRAATQDVKYTIATEACANRATSTANTQAILDKLCQLELDNYKNQLDNKNDTIAQLRADLLYARGQASQDVQTATLRAGQATTANQLVSELRSCPIPSMPVYGQTPIFSCNNGGCGCGNSFVN